MQIHSLKGQQAVIDEVARQLVTTRHEATGSFVRLPVLYPSGASVVVRINADGDRYFVSDAGFGPQEADMMGAVHIYARHGRAVAESAGVKFDNQAFFVTEANEAQLPGAVITIASCSQEATIRVSDALSEKTFEDAKERLYQRIVRVFDPKSVTKDASVIGSSSTRYHVAAFVKESAGRRSTIFDPVTNSRLSVAHASMKFNDIARMPDAPVRVAVVNRKSEFGTLLGVLSQAANVIDDSVSNDTFVQIAKAA